MIHSNKISLTKLQECLINITWLSEDIYFQTEEYNRNDLYNKSHHIINALIKQQWVQMCIIMEEWQRVEALAKDDLYLRDTLYIVTPSIRAVRRWTGLHKFRSTVVAHLNRNKKGEFVPYWRTLSQANYPETYLEVNFLMINILAAAKALELRHQKDLNIAKQILGKDKENHPLYSKKPRIRTIEEFERLKKAIVDETERRTKEKIPY